MPTLQQRQYEIPPLTPEYLAFDHSRKILSITGVFTGVALVTVVSRVYVRAAMLRVFGLDDWVILLSMILSLGVYADFVGQTYHGLGKHVWVISLEDSEILQRYMFALGIMTVTGVSSVKVSVGLSLARLWKGTPYTKFLWAVIIFTILFGLSCDGTLIFQCLPVQASWDYSLRPPPFGTGNAKCYSTKTFVNIALFNSVTNIVTDVLFATMPIPLIWQLKLNTRTKISLVAILSLGYFASAAAIVKAVKQYNFFSHPDWTADDAFNVWNNIEFNVGIIAACLPSLKPIFNWFLETARAITSGSATRTHNRFGYGYGSRSKPNSLGYLKQAESSIAMEDMRTRSEYSSELGEQKRGTPYNVRVSGGKEVGDISGDANRTALRGAARWDNEKAQKSDDSISPLQKPDKCIVRTTEVTISS